MYTSKEAVDLEASYLVILAQYLLTYCAPNSSDYIYLALANPNQGRSQLLFHTQNNLIQELPVNERHSKFFDKLFKHWNNDLGVLGEQVFQGLSLSIKCEGMGLDVHYYMDEQEHNISLEHKSTQEIIDFLIDISNFDI